MKISTIGLDLAKNVFQVHGIDAEGKVVVRKALRRAQVLPFFAKLPPCLVGVEACGTAHHWARELAGLGHEVRQMPPAYVKPYVKRGKTDAADAEAICEAVTRPTMRFVPVKSREQQAALSMHRARDLLVKQRTQLVNMIRGLLAEFGVDIPQGVHRALEMARTIVDGRRQAYRQRQQRSSGACRSKRSTPTHSAERSTLICLPGRRPTIRLAVSCRSPASVQSARRRLPRRSPTRITLGQDGSSPHGWA